MSFWSFLASTRSKNAHRWGFVDVNPGAYGDVSRINLTVFSPGTNRAEWRMLRLAHAWPVAGIPLAFLVLVVLNSWLAPGRFVDDTVGLAFYSLGFVFFGSKTRSLRRSSRQLFVSSPVPDDTVPDDNDHATLLQSTIRGLTDLEQSCRQGEITAVEFEAGWTQIYNRLPTGLHRTGPIPVEWVKLRS